jgi:hypothetical protein
LILNRVFARKQKKFRLLGIFPKSGKFGGMKAATLAAKIAGGLFSLTRSYRGNKVSGLNPFESSMPGIVR